jgi:hypothetical protein
MRVPFGDADQFINHHLADSERAAACPLYSTEVNDGTGLFCVT